jgi:hypothetical protein
LVSTITTCPEANWWSKTFTPWTCYAIFSATLSGFTASPQTTTSKWTITISTTISTCLFHIQKRRHRNGKHRLLHSSEKEKPRAGAERGKVHPGTELQPHHDDQRSCRRTFAITSVPLRNGWIRANRTYTRIKAITGLPPTVPSSTP